MVRVGLAVLLIALGLTRAFSTPAAQEVETLPTMKAPNFPAPFPPAPGRPDKIVEETPARPGVLPQKSAPKETKTPPPAPSQALPRNPAPATLPPLTPAVPKKDGPAAKVIMVMPPLVAPSVPAYTPRVVPAQPTAHPRVTEPQALPPLGTQPPAVEEPLPPPAPPLPPRQPLTQAVAADRILSALLSHAQTHHPELREAAAGMDIASGLWLQAGRHPNPVLSYHQDSIGSGAARQGNFAVGLSQEVVLGKKRQLERNEAGRHSDAAALAYQAKRVEVLARVRRAFHDYAYWAALAKTNDDELKALLQAKKIVEVLVPKFRPRADLLGVEIFVEESRNLQSRIAIQMEAAWRQVLAEAAAPDSYEPPPLKDVRWPSPDWNWADLERAMFANNFQLKKLNLDAQAASWAAARARAERIPNVTVGGGFNVDNVEGTQGGLLTLSMPLRVWDHQRGNIAAAEGAWTRAQAAMSSLEQQLRRDAADAWGRLERSRQHSARLAKEILPRLEERRNLTLQAYQVSKEVTYNDVLLAEQAYFSGRRALLEANRDMWRAVVDLQSLVQGEP